MNDTFDDFTFTDISRILTTKSQNSNNPTTEQGTSTPLSQKNDISFDDSFFINSSSDLSILEQIKCEENKENCDEKQYHIEKSFKQIDESIANIRLDSSEDSLSLLTNNEKLYLGPSQNDKNIYKLASWGLPASILDKYESRKISTMFSWQVECLSNSHVLKDNANLVYSAPTSAGKTLVAEILAIKTVLERDKKVIFILPFVSVVREKMFYFQDIFNTSGVRVEGFMGSYNPPGGFNSVQVAICTIEKANNLVNKLLQEEKINEIGAVVIDEMHLIGDPSRGYLLELLLTKLRYISKKNSAVKIQIIGMSATLPNLHVLAKWLDAQLFVTTFRPIPLHEQALVHGEIYDNQLKLVRKLAPLPELDQDTDNILQLCLETMKANCSVLIFCPTKNWCENLAQQIAIAFYKLGNGRSRISIELREQLKSDLIIELLEQLRFCPVGLDDVLRKTVSFGVGFHHAGLTIDERDIIEGAFRNGIIRILVATSTLSSGVNLPAKRVIIRTPIFHGKPIDALTYRQMIGRAGRMGQDTSGESILVCQPNDYKIAKSLMSAHLEPIESCLEGEGKLKRAILEIVASGVASTADDVELFTKCTLLAQNEAFKDPITDALEFLTNNEFIRLQKLDDGLTVKYFATSLGKACLSSSIPPEDGLSLFTELEKARQCFVLETELHLIYLVTPYSACHQWGNIDWMFYLDLWEKLPTNMKKVGELVGIKEGYLVSSARGKIPTNTPKLYHQLVVHKRFFVALALQDLVNEKPLSEVCAKFNCNRGMLQSLQLSASTFAGMVTAFSKQLGWSSVEILVSQFQDRLHFGVTRDLLDLMRLPLLNGKSARALFNAGLETLIQLANSDVLTIENILHKVMPFESAKLREDETEFDNMQRNKLKNIWITGKQGLTEREAADLLLTSARRFLEIEMGLKEAHWGRNDANDSGCGTEKTEKYANSSTRLDNLFTHDITTSDVSLFQSSITEETHIAKTEMKKSINSSIDSSGDVITASEDDESYVSIIDRTRKRIRKFKENETFIMPGQSPRKRFKLVSNDDRVEFNEIEIVDVCSHENLYSTFCDEIKSKRSISLAVACCFYEEKKTTIGPNGHTYESQKFTHKNKRANGFAISWGGKIVYYLNLTKTEKCLELLKTLTSNESLVIKMFDAKEHVKALKNYCNIEMCARIEDPKIADWLMEPDRKEKNLQEMVLLYCPKMLNVSRFFADSKSESSFSDPTCFVDLKRRSSVECLLTWYLADSVRNALATQNQSFLNVFGNLLLVEAANNQIIIWSFPATEMACLRVLSKMEIVGLGVRETTLQRLVDVLNKEKNVIEKKAYGLAGRRFNFTSSKEVGRVLGLSRPKKQILEKSDHPIAGLVLQWRKVCCTVGKMIQPLIRSVENGRIHGCYVLHTATGRITMHEPNLQNVAKDFQVASVKISCREAFVPREGFVFVSADYCQIELRLLAHLSQDQVLCRIMRGRGDVFKSVAARWNQISESEVTDSLRQKAKQICYGIIYGMGSKTLSEQLSISETDASHLMETFHKAYPSLGSFIKSVIDRCRKNEFVETISGRRRYLSHINDENLAIRNQAERQAVNTTIQGSAADIVKNAMLQLEEKCQEFKDEAYLVLHLHDELLYEVSKEKSKCFTRMLKKTMEESVKLSIPFPVKIKSGPSWGQLIEYPV